MINLITLILTISFSIYLTHLSNAIKSPCRVESSVHYGGIAVNCSGARLKQIPTDLPENAGTLDFSFNRLTSLQNDAFRHLPNLRYIDLSFNLIHTLQVHAFRGIKELKHLELNGHVLNYSQESFPDQVFVNLQRLQKFSLRSDISRFHRGVFGLPKKALGSLTNLRSLNIDTGYDTIFTDELFNLTLLQNLTIGDTKKHGHKFNCGLKILTNETLVGFSQSPISYFHMKKCSLWTFQSGSLQSLNNVKDLYMDGMSLTKGSLSDVFKALHVYKHSNMSTISISGFTTDVIDLPTGNTIRLSTISDICVENLIVSRSNIILIDFDLDVAQIFMAPLSRCIKYINLRNNAIRARHLNRLWYFVLSGFHNLEKIDISLQARLTIADAGPNRKSQIRKHLPLPIFPVVLPPKITSLNVAGITRSFHNLPTIHIYQGEHLTYLNISYIGLTDVNNTIVGLNNLETFDLSHNDMSRMNELFFDTFPNLMTLNLCNVLLDQDLITAKGKRLFSPLIWLKHLDLSQNHIVFIPFDIFDSLVNLQTLSLANNDLLTIPDVTNLVQLQFLHLNHNSFATMKVQYRDMLDESAKVENITVSLSGNTFACACDDTDFLLWLSDTRVMLDGGNYSCMNTAGHLTYTKTVLKTWSSFMRKCHSGFWLNMSIGGLSILTLALIATFVFINNKMRVKLLLLRLLGRNVYPKQRKDFVYDAFIIYPDSIATWVFRVLLNELETNRGIKLNLKDRDHMPGISNAVNISEAIRDSWKIVLLLTEEFLNGDLACFTMCNCLSSITLTTPHRLIVVLHQDLRIPTDIGFLLDGVSQRNIIHGNLEPPFDLISIDRLAEAILEENIPL